MVSSEGSESTGEVPSFRLLGSDNPNPAEEVEDAFDIDDDAGFSVFVILPLTSIAGDTVERNLPRTSPRTFIRGDPVSNKT